MKRGESNKNCANCGAELKGDFCHECGQEKFDLQVSFIHVVIHFLGDYFTFDSKLFKSLIPLLLKPGFLTTEYMSGRRVSYIPPVRIYVFISILYFVFSSLQPMRSTVTDGIEVNGEPLTSLDSEAIKDLEESSESLRVELEEVKSEGAELASGGDDEFERLLLSRLERVQKDTKGFEEAFYRNLPKVMFLLLPLFALLLKLFYVRSGRLLIEHFIFSLHFHSFLFLIMTAFLPLELALMGTAADWIPDLVGIPILAYLFVAMKRHYGKSISGTIGRFVGLLASYSLAAIASLLGLLIYTFFTAA